MSDFRSLTIQSGVVTQIQNANNLVVGSGVTTATGNLNLNSADGYIAVAANKDFKAMAGSGNFDFSNSTGNFLTSTGNVTLGANAGGSVVIDGSSVAINAPTTISESLTSTSSANGFGTTAGIVHASAAGLFTNSQISVNADIAPGTSGQGLLTGLDGYVHWTTFSQDATIAGDGKITVVSSNGNFEVKGNLTVDGTETIIGTSLFQNNATFDGHVLVADGYNLTMGTGAGGSFSQTGSGTFGTGTGAVSLNGATTVTGSNTFTTGTGAVTLKGDTTLDANKSLTATSGTGSLNFSAASGTFQTSTGANTVNGNLTVTSPKTVTIAAFGTAGIVHNAAGGLLSSSLIVNADVASGAAIDGTKISPDFGSQAVTTSGNISTTGSGTIISAGLLTASNGFTVTSGTITLSPLNSAGVVHTNGSGVLSTSQISVATDIAPGTAGQGLLTSWTGLAAWTTFSQDATVDGYGKVTVVSAQGNFQVGGNLTVVGTSLFDKNVTIADGYSLTTNAVHSSTGNTLTLDGYSGFVLQQHGNTVLDGVTTDGYMYVPSGVTLVASGTGQIIANAASAATDLTIPFDTSATSTGMAVYVSANDAVTSADNTVLYKSYCVGFAKDSAASGHVYSDGLVTPAINGPATAGQVMYLDGGANAGKVTATPPSGDTNVVAPVGYMKNATQMIIRVLTPVVL